MAGQQQTAPDDGGSADGRNDRPDPATEAFLAHRNLLFTVAYEMLGSAADAEDVLQETWLRWAGVDLAAVRDFRPYLVRITTRQALARLRSLGRRRESYVGPWLPEPLMPDDMRVLAADTPAAQAELASDLSMALLHVLERLSPEERAAFILHDAFDCEYAEIANMLGKNEPACRKLVSRARERVKTDRPRYSVSKDAHHAMFARFMAAVAEATPNAFQALFADDIVFYSDGGGRVPAAINPVRGADRVARLLAGLMRKFPMQEKPELAIMEINNRLSVVATIAGAIYTIITIEVEGDRITAIYAMRNPEKLSRAAGALLELNHTRHGRA